jgi:tetratricopeptide (TPR) repeat protein
MKFGRPMVMLAQALLLTVSVFTGSDSHSESLTSAISSIRNQDALLADGAWNFQAERKLVGRLDAAADNFHDQAAAGTKLTTASQSLIALMESVHKRYTSVLDAIQAEIIRIDGDLEAAQDSERWQQHELLSMRVLYRLNWIRYETAMRFETNTGKRKKLLERAARGFEEFMGTDNASLATEVLLGHGLVSKALRQYETATSDFSAALEIASDPGMISRLRIGLIEVYITTNRDREALAESKRLLAAGPRGDAAAQALFLRSKALLLALERQASGSTRVRYVKECAKHLESLYDHGAYWKAKVIQLVDAGTVESDEWAAMSESEFVSWLVADSLRRREDCDRALQLYDGLIASERFRSEALYGSGSCSFLNGRYETALEHLGTYLDENAEGSHRDQAAYLRFKGAESIYVGTSPSERDAAGSTYVTLLQFYLDEAPNHDQVFEAWFRLGDWHREHSAYVECAEAFASVGKDNMLSLKAAYLSAQCYVEAVLDVDEEDAAPPELVQNAISSLDTFLADARAADNGSASSVTKSLQAKATVMAASIVTKTETGTMQNRLDRLESFEQDFGEDDELLPEVLSLRIVAYRALGDLDQAGAQLEHLLSLQGAEAYRRDSLKKLGIVFLNEAAERDERNDVAGALRSRKVALRLYERLLADSSRDNAVAAEPLEGLQKLVDDLRSQVGQVGVPPAS